MTYEGAIPKLYLSYYDGGWSTIRQGMPCCPHGDKERAMWAYDRQREDFRTWNGHHWVNDLPLAVNAPVWDGDKGAFRSD